MKTKRKKLVRIEILSTLLTLGNIVCGFWAMTCIIKGQFVYAAWLILLGLGIFDALDGKIARLTRSTSSFGAYLDSLADIVSFGVAPALLIYQLINQNNYHIISPKFTFLICLFYLVCAALRLARYNAETTGNLETHYFSGLPSPGAAGMLATITIFYHEVLPKEYIRLILTLLPFLTLGVALLMVSRFRYIHLLNQITKTQSSFIRLVEVTIAGLIVIFHPEIALCVSFLVYVLSGVVLSLRNIVSPAPREVPQVEVSNNKKIEHIHLTDS